MVKEIPKETLHDILNHKYHYLEIMKIYGFPEDQIEQEKNNIAKYCVHDMSYLADQMSIAMFMTYKKLVGMGEIDADKIFHIRTGKIIDENTELWHGDFAYKGDKRIRYANKEWEL